MVNVHVSLDCKRLPGVPDARTLFNGPVRWPVKRPAKCASVHEQAADKADGVPGKRLLFTKRPHHLPAGILQEFCLARAQ
jgi:hypothetical protein